MYIDIVIVVLCRSRVQGGGCVDGCRSLFFYVSNQVTGNVVVGGCSGRLCKMESRESVLFSNFLHSFYVSNQGGMSLQDVFSSQGYVPTALLLYSRVYVPTCYLLQCFSIYMTMCFILFISFMHFIKTISPTM